MKNKMIKNVVSNVSKAAIQKILKNKNGMKENSGKQNNWYLYVNIIKKINLKFGM